MSGTVMASNTSLFDLLDGESPVAVAQKCKDLREEIFSQKMTLKRQMDVGMDTESYRIAERVHASLDAAESTIQELSELLAESHA